MVEETPKLIMKCEELVEAVKKDDIETVKTTLGFKGSSPGLSKEEVSSLRQMLESILTFDQSGSIFNILHMAISSNSLKTLRFFFEQLKISIASMVGLYGTAQATDLDFVRLDPVFTLALAMDQGYQECLEYLLAQLVNILQGDVIGLLLTRLSQLEALQNHQILVL
mmetsp:Transcript_1254/g.1285  ORF Transcript_1254/g.1285 Transcript_1254/m.1285 type:complete len:167 (+) Transcript_1254:426-926(+)